MNNIVLENLEVKFAVFLLDVFNVDIVRIVFFFYNRIGFSFY